MIINQRKLDFLNFLKKLCISERYIYNLSKKNDNFYMLFHELKNRYIGHAVQHTNPMYVRHALVVVLLQKKRFLKWVNIPLIRPLFDNFIQTPYSESYMNIHIRGLIEHFITVFYCLNNCQSQHLIVIKQVNTGLDGQFLSSVFLSIRPCIHPLITTLHCQSQAFPLFPFVKIYHFYSFRLPF